MNKKIQVLSISFLIALCIMAGCSKKKDSVQPPPVVTIDSVPGSYKNQAFYSAGNTVSFTYNVTSTEDLSMINTNETVIPSSISPTHTSVNKTSGFTTLTSYSANYPTSLPSGAVNVTIKVTATDSKNLSSSASFVARNTIKDQVIGGTNAFYSSITNTVYGSTNFDANKNNIDITFGYFAINNGPAAGVLVSSDQRGQISGVTAGTGGLQTYFQESTKFDSTSFITATAADISKITASNSQYAPVKKGVFEFVSPSLGTKGLINITNYNINGDVSSSTITFDIKVIQ